MLWESQRDHRCQEKEHDIPRTKSLLWYHSLSHHYLCANTLVLAENTLNIFPTIRYASSILSYYVQLHYSYITASGGTQGAAWDFSIFGQNN